MKSLKITKAKPNPVGKDEYRYDIPASQLAGEWIQFENDGDEPYSLDNIEVNHIAYTVSGQKWEVVIDLRGILQVGQSVRVHSGGGPESVLYMVDKMGADYHVFTGKGYIWNNDRIDRPALWNIQTKIWEDETSYDANPGDGIILVRIGEKLVPE